MKLFCLTVASVMVFKEAQSHVQLNTQAQAVSNQEDSRQMQAVSSTRSGRACASNCLDKNQFFCVTPNRLSGVCCSTVNEVCRQEGGFCSFDMGREFYKYSKYAACPSDFEVCGLENTLTLAKDGTELTVDLSEQTNSADFIFSQVCNYEVAWHEEAAEKDQLVLTIDTLPENASLFVTLSDDTLLGKDLRIMQEGAVLRVDYPTRLFVTVKASDDAFDSAFKFSAKFLAADVVVTKVVKKITVVTTVKEDDDSAAAEVALVLLVILILMALVTVAVYFICLRLKNKKRSKAAPMKIQTNHLTHESGTERSEKKPYGLKMVRMKPLLSFAMDDNGKTKMDLIPGDYESINLGQPEISTLVELNQINTNSQSDQNSRANQANPSPVDSPKVVSTANPTPVPQEEEKKQPQEEKKQPQEEQKQNPKLDHTITLEAETILAKQVTKVAPPEKEEKKNKFGRGFTLEVESILGGGQANKFNPKQTVANQIAEESDDSAMAESNLSSAAGGGQANEQPIEETVKAPIEEPVTLPVALPPVPAAVHARTASEVIDEALQESPKIRTPAHELDDLEAIRKSAVVQSPSGDILKSKEFKVAPMVVQMDVDSDRSQDIGGVNVMSPRSPRGANNSKMSQSKGFFQERPKPPAEVVKPKQAMKGAKWAGLGVPRAGSARGSASPSPSPSNNRVLSARSNRSNQSAIGAGAGIIDGKRASVTIATRPSESALALQGQNRGESARKTSVTRTSVNALALPGQNMEPSRPGTSASPAKKKLEVEFDLL